MTNARNNLIAGVFVLAGVALAVWASFLLADRSNFESTISFTVRFPIASGASGLKHGSTVLLGGQEIGRVLDVAFDQDEEQRPTAVDVRVEVRDDLALRESAVVLLEKPLLGTLSSINITDPGAAGVRLAPGTVIAGRTAPPSFLADAGFGPEQSRQVQDAIASIESTMRRVAEVVDRSGPQVDQGVADAAAMLAQLRTKLDEWSLRLDTTTANIEKASGRLEPMLTKAELTIDDARTTIASIRALIDENRARIDSTVLSLERAAAKIDTETIESVSQALREGKDALGVFSDSVARVSALVGEQTPNLRRTLANLRLMSDQLKLTAIEVRSQPWRLLHQPTTKELSSQVLFDATRAYAEAASDLRAASEAMQAAAAIQASGAGDTPDMGVLSAKLTEAIAAYRQAETYLMDKLVEADKK